MGNGARDWSKLMRHPRRRQISDLALVTRCFRILVQQRIYRHSKSTKEASHPEVLIVQSKYKSREQKQNWRNVVIGS